MIAEITNYRPKEMYYTFGNCHIYSNHIDQCKEQLQREPFKFPTLRINHKDAIDNFVYDDFTIDNYQHYSIIRGEVSV